MTIKQYLQSQFAKFATAVKAWANGLFATKEELKPLAPLASPQFSGTPTAPTATSGTNTQQIATTAFVKDAVDTAVTGIKADLGSALTYKGSVADYDTLPKSGQSKGDTYNVVAAHGNTPAGTNYAWDGEKWDPLGGDIDLSGLAEKSTTLAGYGITDAKISDGTITLGNQNITPLVEDDLEGYINEEDLTGDLDFSTMFTD